MSQRKYRCQHVGFRRRGGAERVTVLKINLIRQVEIHQVMHTRSVS